MVGNGGREFALNNSHAIVGSWKLFSSFESVSVFSRINKNSNSRSHATANSHAPPTLLSNINSHHSHSNLGASREACKNLRTLRGRKICSGELQRKTIEFKKLRRSHGIHNSVSKHIPGARGMCWGSQQTWNHSKAYQTALCLEFLNEEENKVIYQF